MLRVSLDGTFGRVRTESLDPFRFTRGCFQIQTCAAVCIGDGGSSLCDVSALAGFVHGGGSCGAHGAFHSTAVSQRAPVLTAHRVPGRASMEAHEGEARRVNRFLDRSWKIGIFERLHVLLGTLVLLKVLHIGGRGLPAPFPRGLLFGHDDLCLLLRDGMKVSRSDARICPAVVVLVVVR